MAKIFYSLAGEGRGHAARARTIVEHLPDHEFVLFTSGDAYAFLAPLYECDPRVKVRTVPGLVFHYTGGRIDLLKTIRRGLAYKVGLKELLDDLYRQFDRDQPSLVITDFEPALPRAANRCGVPLLSLDHQHFLLAYDLSILPWNLRLSAWNTSLAIRMYAVKADRFVVSAFYFPPLRKGWEHVEQVGPLVRPELERLEPARGDFILSYLRKRTPQRVLDALEATGRRIHIYGLGERPPQGGLTFHAIDEADFARDLAACHGLISAAGNQLLGEAMYFGKPVFAIPESRHHEQMINAHFLRWLGGGDFVAIEDFTIDHARSFLARIDAIYDHLASVDRPDGTSAAVNVIESMLHERAERQRHSEALPS